MPSTPPHPFRFTHTSYLFLSTFLAIIGLIMYVWWPLVVDYWSQVNPHYPLWMQMDWLLIGIFLFMTVMIMLGADLKTDAWVVLIGMAGGLVIEGWGTQTHIWTYFTLERPPMWIIPAWPIATLTINRMVRFIEKWAENIPDRIITFLYPLVFLTFYAYMWIFTLPTLGKSLTILALLSVALLILVPYQNGSRKAQQRMSLLLFTAGSALGYFLELWGTTRACWTYYTLQTPPLFAVLAHGLAAVAFWQVGRILLIASHQFIPGSLFRKIKREVGVRPASSPLQNGME